MPRILIVDDEPDILEAMQLAVPAHLKGAQIDTAESAVQAIQMASRNTYDAVVTDQRMPGMNGSALLRWFGTNHPGVRRIVMTAFSGPDMVRDAMEAGAELILLKPMEMVDVARQLSALLAEPAPVA